MECKMSSLSIVAQIKCKQDKANEVLNNLLTNLIKSNVSTETNSDS